MTTETASARWRKTKTFLTIVVAIVSIPFVIIALFASASEGRR